MKQIIRIIGGHYRGKKMTFPESEGLRPTPDRVRETVFNWLMHDIRHARCLDAFAGSGAMGLEAFSRGAGEVFFIEQNRTVFSNLKSVIATFNSPTLKLIQANAIDFIRETKTSFDIIFLDPPFQSNLLTSALQAILASAILNPGGVVYVESAQDISNDLPEWEILKYKKAGQVFYGLLRQKTLTSAPPPVSIDVSIN